MIYEIVAGIVLIGVILIGLSWLADTTEDGEITNDRDRTKGQNVEDTNQTTIRESRVGRVKSSVTDNRWFNIERSPAWSDKIDTVISFDRNEALRLRNAADQFLERTAPQIRMQEPHVKSNDREFTVKDDEYSRIEINPTATNRGYNWHFIPKDKTLYPTIGPYEISPTISNADMIRLRDYLNERIKDVGFWHNGTYIDSREALLIAILNAKYGHELIHLQRKGMEHFGTNT